jgi:hypothetical protein
MCELLLQMVLSAPFHPQLGETLDSTRKSSRDSELHPLDRLDSQQIQTELNRARR